MSNDQLALLQDKSKSTNTALLAKVAVDVPLYTLNPENYFYYSIPDEIKEEIEIGNVVRIPFGKKELNGFVVDILDTNRNKDILESDFKIKSIFEVIYKKPLWDEKYLEIIKWISNYYLTNIGTVLAASLGASEILDNSKYKIELNAEVKDLSGLTKEQFLIIDKITQSKKKSLSYRALMHNIHKAKITKQRFYELINQLKNKGIINIKKREKSGEEKEKKEKKKKREEESKYFKLLNTDKSSKQLVLNKDQEHAFNTILESINKKESKSFLLHGVTGSGKTEVYLKLTEQVINKGKTVIYLVPEIYLITQIYERLIQRFDPSSIIIWHSSLSKNERLNNFEKIQSRDKRDKKDKSVKIILGARSAILVPFHDIGLIVIDEAHDASYKQGSPAPRYDALKVALKRGEIENCPVILGTATPNINDYYNSLQNSTLLELPNRIENIPMPKVYLVDLKQEYPITNKNIISNVLKSSINEALNKNEQIILLLNRRGYSSHIFCMACGFIQYCKNCSVPLTFHKNVELMICHHCGFRKGFLNNESCPECKSPHFKYFGLGTQQLEDEVKKIFKNARTLRVDSDQLKKADDYIKLWQEFSSHKADILIGTQIVSKGLDLPNVSVVGIILADTMLSFPDYVSHERAFQLLTQVTGRAGRGQIPGKVFLQSYKAENPLFKFIQEHDYKSFYNTEIAQREEHSYPPFTTLSRIIFQSYVEEDCINYAHEVMEIFSSISHPTSPHPHIPLSSFLGPAPCFFTKLHSKYRYHILCKIQNDELRTQIFNNLFKRIRKNAKVEMIIDIDSVNLL